MAEKIGVQSVSELITSKAGREYFTLEDFEQKRYVCFNPKLKDYCKVGSEIEADTTPGKSADDSPRIDMIYVNGKPVIEVDKSKSTGRSYGKSDKELLQIRQLAEAQNRSIQAQTALNRAVDLAIADYVGMSTDVDGIRLFAREFYQLLQSLTQISEAQVILKGAKDVKTTKELPDEETLPGTRGVDDTGGGTQVTNAQTLMDWAKKHGKYPSWVRKEALLGDDAISDEIAVKAYQILKSKMNWEE